MTLTMKPIGRYVVMAKFSINLEEAYEALLSQWADELGDNRGSLAAHLIKLCLEKKFPNELPSSPEELPGDAPYELPDDVQLSKWVTMAINLGGNITSPEAFAATSMRGHFSRWLNNYRQRLLDFGDEHELSFGQAYTLVTKRQAPYEASDIEWAKAQPNTMTEARFLGHLPKPGTAPSLNPDDQTYSDKAD